MRERGSWDGNHTRESVDMRAPLRQREGGRETVTERGLQLRWEWHEARSMFSQSIPLPLSLLVSFCSPFLSFFLSPSIRQHLSQTSTLLHPNKTLHICISSCNVRRLGVQIPPFSTHLCAVSHALAASFFYHLHYIASQYMLQSVRHTCYTYGLPFKIKTKKWYPEFENTLVIWKPQGKRAGMTNTD